MFDLEQAIMERHSTRLFLHQPVPRELLDEAVALAVQAPSNSNIEPWHMVFASGQRRDRLVAALLAAAQSGPPDIPPLPESFKHFRSELVLKCTGRWESLARTRKGIGPPYCATGSFSERP